MEGSRQRRYRQLERCFEPSRLAEELWIIAYEEIVPLVRRKPRPSRRHETAESPGRETLATRVTKRA